LQSAKQPILEVLTIRKLLGSLLCSTFNNTKATTEQNLTSNNTYLTQLSEAFVKRFTPLLDQDLDRGLQDISLILFECLVQAPSVNVSWTLRQLTSIFSQYIMITRERRMVRVTRRCAL
jgi:hypothetical protein